MYDSKLMINRIKSIKKEQKLSNERLSVLSGVPKGTLAKILGSETRDPQISNIIKISQALGVSADYIIFGETQNLKKSPPPLSAEEKMIIDSYRKFNTDGKKHLIEQITMMNTSGLYNEDKVIKIVARTGHTTSTVPENLDDFPDAPDTI